MPENDTALPPHIAAARVCASLLTCWRCVWCVTVVAGNRIHAGVVDRIRVNHLRTWMETATESSRAKNFVLVRDASFEPILYQD
jgi:hypothetical protein